MLTRPQASHLQVRSRMSKPLLLCAGVLSVLLNVAACISDQTSPAAAQMDSVGRGRAVAENVCSACHAVGPGQVSSPNPNAPTFEHVANTPGMTARALSVWMRSPHPTMPNYVLTQGQIDDVSAYLESLRAR